MEPPRNVIPPRVLGLATLVAVSVVPALASDAIAGTAGASRPSVGARVEMAAFVAELKAPPRCTAGRECVVHLTLTTKGAYQVDEKYRSNFVLIPARGVTYPKEKIAGEGMKISPTKIEASVSFTAAKSGRVSIEGVFSFGVMTESNYSPHKLSMDVDVDVR